MPSIFDSAVFNQSLFFPRADRTRPPPSAVDLLVDTTDGAKVHVRMHGQKDGHAATLLLFHGNGEVVADYDDAAELFAEAGAALSVADFRGYGASTGTPTLRNALLDAPIVLAAILERTAMPVIVMGRSLGGASAAALCQKARSRVVGYVFESSGSDLAALVKRRGIPVPEFTPNDLASFDPLPKMASCTTKTLVLHGERDMVIDFREAEATHRAIAVSTLCPIPQRGHNDVASSKVYWDALASFVALCTGNSSP